MVTALHCCCIQDGQVGLCCAVKLPSTGVAPQLGHGSGRRFVLVAHLAHWDRKLCAVVCSCPDTCVELAAVSGLTDCGNLPHSTKPITCMKLVHLTHVT